MKGGAVAAEVQLRFESQTKEASFARLMNAVVTEVIEGCRRRGSPADPVVVRLLVEREWAEFAGARVQTYLPVLVSRAVSSHLRRADSHQQDTAPP